MLQLIRDNIMLIPDGIGIYRVFALNEDLTPKHINRFCGIDTTGTLYIGRTTAQGLKKRIYQALAVINPLGKSTGHSGALKYKMNKIIAEFLNDHKLYFDYEVCAHPAGKERELLNEYASKFGELPPLNK
ncbi:MAG: hypothetical protein ACTHMM_20295 [Agriterribacter sp.]